MRENEILRCAFEHLKGNIDYKLPEIIKYSASNAILEIFTVFPESYASKVNEKGYHVAVNYRRNRTGE